MKSFALVDVELFDGYAFRPHQTVVVEQGLVSAVGAFHEVPLRHGLDVIPGPGKTLLPGFVDCHVHIELLEPIEVLRGGVTTARDLGWPADRIFSLTSKLQKDGALGPRLLAAGPMITARGGYPTRERWAPAGTGLEVSSEEEASRAVTRLWSAGASVIKVAQESRGGPLLELAILARIVEEAHALGLKVTSHVGSLEQLEVALVAGIDELAHGLWSDEQIPAPTLDRMVDAAVVVVPTLHIDPTPARIDNLRRFLAAGGLVVYGTDMGNSGPPPGVDVKELELMMEAGMSLEEVLRSATSGAAGYLGLEDVGAIRNEAKADLLLVDGQVREDISCLSRPEWSQRG